MSEKKTYTIDELLGESLSDDDYPDGVPVEVLQAICELQNAATCFVILVNEVMTPAGLQLAITTGGASKGRITSEALEAAGVKAVEAYNQTLKDLFNGV